MPDLLLPIGIAGALIANRKDDRQAETTTAVPIQRPPPPDCPPLKQLKQTGGRYYCVTKDETQCNATSGGWWDAAHKHCVPKTACVGDKPIWTSDNTCAAQKQCSPLQKWVLPNTCRNRTESECSGTGLTWAGGKCQDKAKCTPSQYYQTQSNTCVAKATCTPTQMYQSDNTCKDRTESECSGTGLTWAGGKCQEKAKCTPSQYYQTESNTCVTKATCTPTQMYQSDNTCKDRTESECSGADLTWIGGKCQEKAKCGTNCGYNAQTNQCEMPAGYYGDVTKQCQQVCPSAGQVRNAQGLCVDCGKYGCSSQFHCHPDGLCKAESVSQSDCQKAPGYDYVWVGGKCVPQAQCNSSEFWKADTNTCVAKKVCPANEAYQSDNTCKPKTRAECSGSGIMWSSMSDSCVMTPPCAAPKIINSDTAQCEAKKVCDVNQTWAAPNTCTTKSEAECTGVGVAWSNGTCIKTGCTMPKIKWTGNHCVCPDGRCKSDCSEACRTCEAGYWLDRDANVCNMKCPDGSQTRDGFACICGEAAPNNNCPTEYPYCITKDSGKKVCSNQPPTMYLVPGDVFFNNKCQNVKSSTLQSWSPDSQFSGTVNTSGNRVGQQFRMFVQSHVIGRSDTKQYTADVETQNWKGTLTFGQDMSGKYTMRLKVGSPVNFDASESWTDPMLCG